MVRTTLTALAVSTLVMLAGCASQPAADSSSRPGPTKDPEALSWQGRYEGTGATKDGAAQKVEVTLDAYGCFVYLARGDKVFETGFYKLDGGTLTLTSTEGAVVAKLRTGPDVNVTLLTPEGRRISPAPQGCCTLVKQ